MRKSIKSLATMLAVIVAVLMLGTACNQTPKFKDYASTVSLDLSSETKKQEVTVRLYIDGDTTHFDPIKNSQLTPYNAADFADTQGYIKARYMAINTPESTGKIEEWGKRASDFTHDRLASATSIIVESDDENWNVDSTGERYMLWVWYLPEGETEYRNLNLEILQEGLALGSAVSGNRYGTVANNALTQARNLKYYVFSDEEDPDFDYSDAGSPVTLKELRYHAIDYTQKKVRVEGVVVAEFDNSVYIEDYDKDTGLYFGMSVYYGFQTGKILDVLTVGNRVRVVGAVTEFNGTYQISGVSHDEFTPDLPSNTVVLSEGHQSAFVPTTAKDIVSGKHSTEFEIVDEDGNVTYKTVELNYGEVIMSTTVTVSNLKVLRTYTTHNGGDNDGAISLTCQAEDGTQITVRTTVLKDAEGNLVTADRFKGKTITVKGVVDKYEGEYQVKCYRVEYITILD